MKTDAAQLNLVLAWTGILLGFVSGMVLGLFFRREDWLGGYASFKRRMYRLGHISFFGLGAVNLFFWLTVKVLSASSPILTAASWLFVVGAVTMPICCVVIAHFPKLHLIFSVPVVSLIAGGVLMLFALGRCEQSEAARAAGNFSLSPKNSRLEPLNLVGTRSTASPSFRQTPWDAGETRLYQIQREVHEDGERFDSPLYSRTSNQAIPTSLNLFQP